MGLNREHVVRAGLEVLDEIGLDALTMRKVANRLGVQLNTVYWHAASKPALLAAMADLMLEGCADEPLPRHWQKRLRELAHRYRGAMLAHRDGARVIAGTFPVEPRTLQLGEAFVSTLLAGGIEPRTAAWSAWAIAYYTMGITQEQQAITALEHPVHLAEAVTADRYPALSHVADFFGPDDFDRRFDFGLDLMIANLS